MAQGIGELGTCLVPHFCKDDKKGSSDPFTAAHMDIRGGKIWIGLGAYFYLSLHCIYI